MKEFNLSEKINDFDVGEDSKYLLKLKDVKEFIRRLKLSIAPYSPYIDIIDKLAGDKFS